MGLPTEQPSCKPHPGEASVPRRLLQRIANFPTRGVQRQRNLLFPELTGDRCQAGAPCSFHPAQVYGCNGDLRVKGLHKEGAKEYVKSVSTILPARLCQGILVGVESHRQQSGEPIKVAVVWAGVFDSQR